MTITRMHSSGMHTTHLLTISQHALHRWGLPGGVCLGGCLPRAGCLPRGVLMGVSASGLGGVFQHAMGQTPPMDRHTPVKTQPSQTFAGAN